MMALRFSIEAECNLKLVPGGTYSCIPVPRPQYERTCDIPKTLHGSTFHFSREEQLEEEHLELFKRRPTCCEHIYKSQLSETAKELGLLPTVLVGICHHGYVDARSGDTRAIFSLIDSPKHCKFAQSAKRLIDSGDWKDVSLTHNTQVRYLPWLNGGAGGYTAVGPKEGVELSLTRQGARPGSRIILTKAQAANGERIRAEKAVADTIRDTHRRINGGSDRIVQEWVPPLRL